MEPRESDLDRQQIDMEIDRREQPDRALGITRRIFINKAILAGTAVGAASVGWFPIINTVDLAFGQQAAFKFAWISDTHLYPKAVNTRFVDKAVRAVQEIKAMNPPADFLIFGGDLAQLGDPVELALGADILKELTIRKVFIPGEHDWYLDLGAKFEQMFGKSPWSFDHKGVRFIGLNTVGHAPDYWSAKKMTPKERMGDMATLDGSVAGPWAGVGEPQRRWLDQALSNWPKNQPVVVFTHTPLYEYYPPWNFWTRDWREVNEILKPFGNVTNIHGHTHQVLYNEVGKMRSIGMLATSWPWPYAPQGVPVLTKPMIRADPGDHFDGVGWSRLTATAAAKIENEYVMFGRKAVFAEAQVDSGTGDNGNQILHPRIADRLYPY
jgi:3',5'-cyclic AMP phosphodiesterase CpdA